VHQRAPRHQRRWGLLVEDEFKTDAATLIQDAYRGLVATLLYLAASVKHDVVVHGREHISGYHPCIYVSNHKRDFDSFVIGGVTYFARGILHPNTRLIFALREDAMWSGFLGYLDPPWPLNTLVSGFSVRAALAALKVYPIGYLRRREDLARIQAQLRALAELLDRGRDVYWTAEGGLGLDGRFGQFRAGFHRLIRGSRATLHMVPVAVFYDFMTTLRTRCFIRIGPETELDRSLSRPELERLGRAAILRQMTVNIGHLAAAVLRDPPAGAVITRDQLSQSLLAQARRLQRAGLAIDARLLGRFGFNWRLDQLLGYARRQRILDVSGGGWRVALGMQHPQMQYVHNELLEVERELKIG
jgi:hypothetical protein